MAILATATSWAAEKTILLQNIGESASETSTESVSQVAVKASGTSDSYTLNYLQGKKHDKSILLAKSKGAFISNKTPIPGEIKSIKVYINTGASGKTTYYCAFTSSECLKAYNQGCTAVKIAGGQNHTFTNTTVGATYFCISLGNANNGQILSVEITYNEGSPKPQKTPTTLSFGEGVDGQTFTKYIGEKGFTYTATLSPVVEGATIDYSSTDENVAFVLGGEVELQKKEGVATIKASYAGNDTYGKSEASYTIDLKKLPINFSIPSGTAVAAGTKVTLSTIEGATLMYQIDGGDLVDVNSNTTDITIEKGCTIEAVASYNGANEGAQATYSIKEVKTITSFEISGTPTKTNYYVGEAFDHSGLKASATFSDNTTEDVTANATWTLNPASFTDATQNEVTVTATYEGATDTKTYPVTVTAIENTKETAYTVAEAIKLIDNGKTDVRVYVKGIVSKIVTPYNKKYKNITFDVSDDGATTTPQFQFFRNQKDAENTYAEDPKIEVGATVIGYGKLTKFEKTHENTHEYIYEFDAGNYLVEYTAPVEKEVKDINVTSEPTHKEYYVGESFNPEGLIVTAIYSDGSTADVTADATWMFDPDVFSATGSVTVGATIIYGDINHTEEYTVTVSERPSLTLKISPESGVYHSAQTVTIEANNAAGDVVIYYTTDGSDPALTGSSKVYTAPFEVTKTTIVKAYAIDGIGRKTTAASDFTIRLNTLTEENFNGCTGQGGRDGFFEEVYSGLIEDHCFDCMGWGIRDKYIYQANSCAKLGSKFGYNKWKKGELFSPPVAGTNYNAISFDIAGCDNGSTNTLTVTINDGGAFADGTTSKSFTATNGKWTTFTEKIKGLTPRTTFDFGGNVVYLDAIILTNISTLAELAENGTEGKKCIVNDEMVVAKKFQKAGKNYIVVKDAVKAVRNFSTPVAGDKFFNINGNKQEEYAQNNWMLVSLPVELYNQVNEKSTVTSITGTLTEKLNVAMEATNVVFENVTNDDFAPNTYCPINFLGKSSVKGANPAYTSSYYFATPKANEYANVVWAVYNKHDGAFYIPEPQGSVNAQGFDAAFCVDYSLNSVDNPELTDGSVYSFEALVKEETRSTPIYGAISTKFVVYPLDLDDTKVATGVNDVNSAKEVKGVSYFNMMGVESAQPFDGVNIMVTTYTDGTSSATKVVR